jgi:UDP-N-acetylglucosamine--N-acetylmuramyl-(pentapeptide) pyrophosphoryl-undecaprenol N-acetylglucosamine transferase
VRSDPVLGGHETGALLHPGTDAMPGVTNKILSRFVDEVFLGYQEGARYFASHARKIYTGNPVRREILEATRQQGIQKFNLNPNLTTLLVFGGSRGARTINQAMIPVEQKLAGHPNIQILHATGTVGYEKHVEAMGEDALHAPNIHVVPYLHDMPLALAAADIAVSRAGAIGLAELMVKGIPVHPGALSLCNGQPSGIQCPGPGRQRGVHRGAGQGTDR